MAQPLRAYPQDWLIPVLGATELCGYCTTPSLPLHSDNKFRHSGELMVQLKQRWILRYKTRSEFDAALVAMVIYFCRSR
jgi:hypothetical protein